MPAKTNELVLAISTRRPPRDAAREVNVTSIPHSSIGLVSQVSHLQTVSWLHRSQIFYSQAKCAPQKAFRSARARDPSLLLGANLQLTMAL